MTFDKYIWIHMQMLIEYTADNYLLIQMNLKIR